jgi:hypothetical protein
MHDRSVKAPSMWLGATWASVIVLSFMSLFMAAMFGAAVATHDNHHGLGLTGMGAAMFVCLAALQAKSLVQARRS